MNRTHKHTMRKDANGKWIKNENELNLIRDYLRSLPPGSEVTVYYETPEEKKSLAQLRYIHNIIAEISSHTGQSFDVIKDIIKYKTGIKDEDDTYKSFGYYTKKEMTFAIHEAISLANFVGITVEIQIDLLNSD